MKTAKEMEEFARKFAKPSKGMIKGFSVIEAALLENENVNFSIGIFIGDAASQVAAGITENRVIIGQKRMLSDNTITITLDAINDVSLQSKLTGEYITISNTGDNVTFSTFKGAGREFVNVLHHAIDNKKKDTNGSITPSDADEIIKFKKLFDDGVITEDEFNAKKKQLLGL